VWRESS